jgi:mono/diheme cytochrome c family protein
VDDPDRSVRIQAAATLGQSRAPGATSALERALRRHGGDRFIRAASVSSLAGREVAMLQSLLTDPAWPESESAWSVLTLLADTALRAGPGPSADLADLAGELAVKADGRAWLLVSRIRQAQQLSAVSPKPLELAREPVAWLAAAANPGCLLAGPLTQSAAYFDWPGRPRVHRPKNLRPLTGAEQALYAKGEGLYALCAGCHLADGRGSPGLAPAIAGSARVEGPESKLARILLHGVQGEYISEGVTFEGMMPPAPLKDDEEVAAVMTYIRRAFQNAGDPVTPDTVGKVRDQTKDRIAPWTKQELDPPGGFP